ncbi:hypothetical protein DSECCO2_340240 [anaerobic digester metagenome]
MKVIKQQKILLTALLLLSVAVTMWSSLTSKDFPYLLMGINLLLWVLLLILNQHLSHARRITSNAIWTFPSSYLKTASGKMQRTHGDTVISNIGLLVGSKVYPWDTEGSGKDYLKRIRIDQQHLQLTFGKKGTASSIEIVHGIKDSQQILKLKDELWQETGVCATISGWDGIIHNQAEGCDKAKARETGDLS